MNKLNEYIKKKADDLGLLAITDGPSEQYLHEICEGYFKLKVGMSWYMENAINELIKERERQNQKFGEQNYKPLEWIAILGEEFGECSKEAVEHHFEYYLKEIEYPSTPFTNDDLKKYFAAVDEFRNKLLNNYRTEMIQVAAVAIQAVESLDRQTNNQFVINQLKSK